MTTLPENRRIMYLCAWLAFFCLLAALITSCSPYAAMSTTVDTTPTAAPSVTTTAANVNKSLQTPTTTPPACKVIAYTLYMRTGAGMSNSVKQILYKGDRVTVIARRGDWLQIETARRVRGWVYQTYCK